nr:hypothetical protein [Tanacetum cinerariifolium]
MAHTPVRNHEQRGTHQQYARMTLLNPQKQVVPTVVLTQFKLVPITVARPVTAAVPNSHVTKPRQAKSIVTKPHSPPRRNINHSPSLKASNFPLKVTAVKARMVNVVKANWCNLQHALKDKGVIDSRCSRHMTGNMSYLFDFEELNSGYVAFGGNPKGGKIFGKGKIGTGKLDFDDVYFVKELKFNLFSVSQMCDKKNSVLFTDTKCLLLSHEFRLPDENQVLLRVPRENNMYNEYAILALLFAFSFVFLGLLIVTAFNFIGLRHASRFCSGPTWLFDIDTLTTTMNYQPVTAGNQSNPSVGVQEQHAVEKAVGDDVQQYVLFFVWSSGSNNPQNTDGDAAFEVKEHGFKGRKPQSEVHVSPSSSTQTKKHDDKTKREAKGKGSVESSIGYKNLSAEFEDFSDNSINEVNAIDSPVLAVGHIPTTKVHKDHHVTQIIGDLSLTTQTRSMSKVAQDQGGISQINNDDFHTCMFVCFLSQEEPKRVHQALKDPSWIEAMQDKLLQLKMQKVWVLVDLPHGKRAIGYTQEKIIDYEEVFALVVRIEAIRLFLAYASFMGFMVYQMDVKSTFLYRTIKEEVYVCQPLGFEDPDYPNKVYKVVKALYGLHQAPRAWYETLANYLLKNGFQRGKIDQTLFIKQKKTSVSVKKVNDVTRLQALVDKKKVIITEATIRDALLLDDAKGIDCLPNEEFFVELSRMGAEVGDLSSHTTKYSSPSLTQKMFANMRRVGKGFSGVDTPLFEGIIVAQQVDESAVVVNVNDVPDDEGVTDVNVDVVLTVQPTLPPSPIAQPPSPQQQPQPSQDAKILMDLLYNLLDTYTTLTRRVKNLEQDNIAQALEITKLKQRVKKLERRNKLKGRIITSMDSTVDVTLKDVVDIAKEVAVDAEIEESADVLSMQEDEVELVELQEILEVVTTTKLITEVVTAASATIIVAAPTLTTTSSATRRRKGVVIRDPKETATPSTIIHSKAKSKDKGKWILVEEPKPLTKQAQFEQDEAYAREEDKGTEEEDSRALKRLSESQEDKAAKSRSWMKRFASSKPKNLSDDFLLTTLTYMFEKPDVQAQMIFLVERRYLLTRFTLDQMLNNVRLEVEEESKVSLELLRFIRQQQQEGFRPE